MMNRRRFLLATGVALTAGCLSTFERSDDSGSSDPDSRRLTPRPESAENPTDTAPIAQFQSDARNTGLSGGTVPTSIGVDWNTELSTNPHGVIAADGTVIVGYTSHFVALEAGTGETLWEVVGHTRGGAMPAVSTDTVYVPIANPIQEGTRGIEANALETGDVRWRAIEDVDVTAPPTLTDDTLYAAGVTDETSMFAVDATTGENLWRTPLDEELGEDQEPWEKFSSATAPAVADGRVYAGAGDEHAVVALDAADGAELWRFDTDEVITGDPTIHDGTIYVGTQSGRVYALDAAGDERWSRAVLGSVTASPAVTDDGIYLSGADEFVALSHDGDEHWSVDLTRDGLAPTVTEEAVVCADDTAVFGLDASDGTELWRHEFEERKSGDAIFTGKPTQPVVADDRVYVTSDAGRVYALENS